MVLVNGFELIVGNCY